MRITWRSAAAALTASAAVAATAAAAIAPAPAQATTARHRHLVVTDTISVGHGPGSIGVDPLTNRIYVANHDDDTVSVISGRTATVIATITLAPTPQCLAVNPLTNTIYVVNGAFGQPRKLFVISGRTNTVTAAITVQSPTAHKVLATVRLGGTPFGSGVVVDQRAGKVYVATFPPEPKVLVIGGRTDKIIATIKIRTFGISPNSLTGNIWLAKPGTSQVAVLSGHTYKVISTARVGQNPGAIGVDPLTSTGYAANSGSDTVSVLRWHT